MRSTGARRGHEASLRGTLLLLREFHTAWNERRWQDYAALLDPRLKAHPTGEDRPEGKLRHLERMRAFCRTFPDARRHIDPCLDMLVSHDGLRSASVLNLSGQAPDGRPLRATGVFILHWQAGCIISLREFLQQA
ncbi:ester cyclase [Rhodovarius crocodyli]|uniref:ester cyclase n=1 Tax=Rhodovarius crocodyli TaxID=1979269 RepID=UPI0013E33408|nr:ester cyclase [Rhodovarius crocodyli]